MVVKNASAPIAMSERGFLRTPASFSRECAFIADIALCDSADWGWIFVRHNVDKT